MFDIVGNVLIKYHGSEVSVTVPDGVKMIGESAFEDNLVLEKVRLPEGVDRIAHHAFAGCHTLHEIILPLSLRMIDCYAFSGCDSLHQIEIPGCASVDDDVFHCTPLDRAILHCRTDLNKGLLDTKLRLTAGLCPFCEYGHLISSADRQNAKCDICGQGLDEAQRQQMKKLKVRDGILLGGEGDGFLSIPAGIRRIQSRAFDDSYIRGAEIPDSVTEIGVGAFAWCDRMQHVQLPAGLKRIEASCFNLAAIDAIEIPKATQCIGCHAFSGSEIRRVLFNDQLKVIGPYAFYHADNLKAVSLPEGLEILGEYAFSRCESLEAVVIPGSVASIESRTFQTCERLQHVIIKEGVNRISDEAFKECISLQNIVLPDSLLSIGNDAFVDCDVLTNVEMPIHLKGLYEDVFPAHTHISYRASSNPTIVQQLIQCLPDNEWYGQQEIMETIKHYAEEGDVEAMMHLANCFQSGRYTRRSESMTRYWYEKAAARGCLRARWWLLSKRSSYESNYRVDLLRLVRAGCEEAVRTYAAFCDE